MAQESDGRSHGRCSATLTNAGAKSALDVEDQVDQLRIEAQSLTNRGQAT